MSRQSIASDNPIRKARLDRQLSLQEFAKLCDIHLQAVYLNEVGVYPSILPSILRRLVDNFGLSRKECLREYGRFVSVKRRAFGEKYSIHSYLPSDSDIRVSPITKFRSDLNLSQSSFSKGICCQPSAISRTEKRKSPLLPDQLYEALLGIDLPLVIIREFSERQAEFYYG